MSPQGLLYAEGNGVDFVPGTVLFRVRARGKLLSLNNVYRDAIIDNIPGRRAYHKRVLTTKGKKFRAALVAYLLSKGVRPAPDEIKTGAVPLYIRIWVHASWWVQERRVKRILVPFHIRERDVFNLEKVFVDAVFPFLELKDSWIFQGYLEKVEDEIEGWTFEVGTLVPAGSCPTEPVDSGETRER